MKYFNVRIESITGPKEMIDVDIEGNYINTSDEGEYQTISTGFIVDELDEMGIIVNSHFYPILTNMEDFSNNEQEVLEKIKKDYPASEWQNHNW